MPGIVTGMALNATFGTVVVYGNVIARLGRTAHSFDEVIVTTFTAGPARTLPIRILNNLSRPDQLPIVNVVPVFIIPLSMIPVYLAQRLSRDSGAGVTARR